MAKLLNLDEIAPKAEKVIVLKGKEHEMKPVSVGDFIRLTQEVEDMAGKEIKVSEQFKYFIKTVMDSFPTIEEEVLTGLTLEKLRVIVDFIRAEAEEEVDGAEGEGVKK